MNKTNINPSIIIGTRISTALFLKKMNHFKQYFCSQKISVLLSNYKKNFAFLTLIMLLNCIQAQKQAIDTTQAREYFKKAESLLAQAKYDSAGHNFEKASTLYRTHKIWEGYIKSRNGQGYSVGRNGQKKTGLEILQKILDSASQYLGKENKIVAQTYYYTGVIYEKSGQYTAAIEQYQHAIRIHKQQQCIDHLKVASLDNYIGVCFLYTGNYQKALDQHQKALRIRIEYLGEKHKAVAHCYNSIGVVYGELSQLDKALVYYQKALGIRISLFGEEHKDVAQSYYNIGGLHSNSGQQNSALTYVEKALSIFKKVLGENHANIGAVNNNLGNIHLRLGNYYKSVQHQKKALAIFTHQLGKDHPHLAYAYNSIGTAYKSLGRYNLALENYQNALTIEINKFGKEHPSSRITYTEMGDVYSLLGQYHKALDHYKKGLNIHIKHFGLDNPEIVNPYINMGIVYKKLEEYDTALVYYQKALDIGIKTWGEYHLDVADPYQNMAVIYQERKQYTRALSYFQKALKIRKDLLGDEHPKLAELYNNLGYFNLEFKQYDQSLKYYNLALGILQKSMRSHHPDLAKQYNSLGKLYQKQHKYDEALVCYQKAIISNIPEFTETKLTVNPKPRGYLSGLVLLESLKGKAMALGQLKNEFEPYSNLLIETYLLCDTLINQLRQATYRESDKILIGEISREIYQNAMAATNVSQKGSITTDLNILHTALFFSEKNKATVLSEALHENKARHFARIPDSIVVQEKALKEQYAFFYQKLTGKLDTLKKQAYQDQLFLINKKLESLIANLEQQYPEYYTLKYNISTVSIPQLQQTLKKNSALLTYFISDTVLYSITITKDTATLQQFLLPEDFDTTLEQVLKMLTTYPDYNDKQLQYKKYTQSAHQLYNWVLQKPLAQLNPAINSLIIIPDGKLNYLSFDALLTDFPAEKVIETTDYSQLAYLTKRYQISYAASATLWHEASTKRATNDGSRTPSVFGGFAPEYTERTTQDSTLPKLVAKLVRDGEMPLPGAKEEVQQIAKIIDGDAWTGIAVSEKMFKDKASQYQILHLAMHALLDDEEPLNSSFVFADSPQNMEDGYLYASELYAMPIAADLVVLSACNSGGGSLKKGEGLMSLSRTFMYAGCPSQVMSLWKVSDLASKQIMIDFYKGLKDEKTIDAALRDAKLAYLEQIDHPNYSHPFFWASFAPIGVMDSIKISPETNFIWWYWLVIGIGVLVLIRLVSKRYKP